MGDLVTMEPKLAGELTAAEKYIIKSRLRIEFWKAEETPSFICSSHRALLTSTTGLQVCSVCGKRKSKKFDMYFITYRMAVEFYMTEGRYLAIGRLACSTCKIKGLKGLDFSNSYLVPESGHPLEQEGRKRPREVEEEGGGGGGRGEEEEEGGGRGAEVGEEGSCSAAGSTNNQTSSRKACNHSAVATSASTSWILVNQPSAAAIVGELQLGGSEPLAEQHHPPASIFDS